jgi:hypothetical protein
MSDPNALPAVDAESVFVEPLNVNEDGTPKLTKQGAPFGKPGWEPGHLVGAYWGGSYVVNAVWVVVNAPDESQLEDWAWETRVRLVAKDRAVPIQELGVSRRSLMRRVRLRLRPEQETLLRKAFHI